MTAFSAPADCATDPAKPTIPLLALAATITAAADWLFYGHWIGISFAIFMLMLVATTAATNVYRTQLKTVLTALLILGAGIAPSIEDYNPLSILCGLLGAALAVTVIAAQVQTVWQDRLRAMRNLLLLAPFRLLPDIARTGCGTITTNMVMAWIVPLLLGTVFLALFASANPMIEIWITALHLGQSASRISTGRVLFWCAMLSFVWPFVCVRLTYARRKAAVQPQTVDAAAVPQPVLPTELFGPEAIFRSLILFNLLFAVQTVLDIVYLWAGVALPDGMTYATYAHRGAYPLIVTALLAAGFILHATDVEQTPQRKRLVDALIVIWTAQNLILVLSSILRLDRYVEAYSLTYWRVAAFVWMGLVAAGLLLILIRIVQRRSNGWLIHMNLITLASVLYLCSFVNFAAIVADYNVADSHEMGGKGPTLDTDYLVSLGPQAIPAIDRFLAIRQPASLVERRDTLAHWRRAALNSWRAWTFRGWRLKRYLDRTNAPKADNHLSVPAPSIP
jgi:Domain of unknown function (DUF4173)